MKDKNKFIIAIVAVLSIIAIVGGATYAYWTWTTNTAQRTTVEFTISKSTLEGQLYAKLDGGGSTTVSSLAPVSACTNSTYAMKRAVTLKYLNNTTNDASVTATLTLSNFTAPHGTPDADDLAHLHYALTTSSTSCTGGIVSGTFKSTSGALFSDIEIKSVSANTATEGSQTYYLWVWLDSEYTHPNEGSVISDPMQDISFSLTWSGMITNEIS